MCGLVGFSGNNESNSDKLQLLMYMNSVERGEDNTGYFTPETGVKKDNNKAKIFLKKNKLPNSKLFIGHVRKGSVGGRLAKHSHPFEFDNIVMAHNGTLENHWKLLTDHGYELKDFDVDSEVLAKLLDDDSKKEEIYHNEKDERDFSDFKALTKFIGEAALLFTDKRNPNLLYVYRTSLRTLYKGYLEDDMYISSIEESLDIIGCEKITPFTSNWLHIIENGKIIKEIYYKPKEKPSVITQYPSYNHYKHNNGSLTNTFNYDYDNFEEYNNNKLNKGCSVNNNLFKNNIYGIIAKKNSIDYVGKHYRCLNDFNDTYGKNKVNIEKDSWYLVLDNSVENNVDLQIVDDNGDFVTINKFFLDPNSDNIKDYCYIISDVKKKVMGMQEDSIIFEADEIVEVTDYNKLKCSVEAFSNLFNRTFEISTADCRKATEDEIELFKKEAKAKLLINATKNLNTQLALDMNRDSETDDVEIINFEELKEEKNEIEDNLEFISENTYQLTLNYLEESFNEIYSLITKLQEDSEKEIDSFTLMDLKIIKEACWEYKEAINNCREPVEEE